MVCMFQSNRVHLGHPDHETLGHDCPPDYLPGNDGLKLWREFPGFEDSVGSMDDLMPSLDHFSDGMQLSLHLGVQLEAKTIYKRFDLFVTLETLLVDIFHDGFINEIVHRIASKLRKSAEEELLFAPVALGKWYVVENSFIPF